MSLTNQDVLIRFQQLDNLVPRGMPKPLIKAAMVNASRLQTAQEIFQSTNRQLALKHAEYDGDNPIPLPEEDQAEASQLEQQLGIKMADEEAYREEVEDEMAREADVDVETVHIDELMEAGCSIVRLSAFSWMIDGLSSDGSGLPEDTGVQLPVAQA